MVRRRSLLLLDEEEAACEQMVTHLARFRDWCDVQIFSEGIAAEQLIARNAPDLVLMDPRLPDLNGVDLIRAILQDHPETDVIGLLPAGMDAIARQTLEAGAVEILTKPYQASQVEEVVARCIGIQVGLRGDVEGISLSDLVQLINAKKWDRTIVVANGDSQSGSIHFKKGEIQHAETGDLTGLDAFNAMLEWPQGSFEIRTGCISSTHSVLIPTMQVLLDGLRKSDEGTRGVPSDLMGGDEEIHAMFDEMMMPEGLDEDLDELDLPPPVGFHVKNPEPPPVIEQTPKEKAAATLARCLETLRQRWDLSESCAIVNQRGFVLAGQIEDEITDNFWSQLFGTTAAFFDETSKYHKRGHFREAILVGTEGCLVALTIHRSSCFLVATTRAEARIGLILTGLESSLEEIGLALQEITQ